MLYCSLLVPQCAARRQSEGSGAAKKDYQEVVNWGHYMKEKNPNSWKKWESGEINYTPAPDKQP